MKKITLILLMLFPLVAFCQSSGNNLFFGLNFSPDYCYRTLKPDASVKWIAENRDSIEVPKLGYTIGFNIIYKINSRLNIEGGLQFSDKGEKTNWVKYNLHSLQPDPVTPIEILSVYSYQYLDIPIKVNYVLMNNTKIKLFVSAGISSNLFLAQRTKVSQKFDGGSIESSSSKTMGGYNVVNFAILAGIGMDYDLNDKIKFRIEPIYRRSLNSIVNAPIKGYLYSAGLNIGVYINI